MKRVLLEMMGVTEAARSSSGHGWYYYGGKPKTPDDEISVHMDSGAEAEEDYLAFDARQAKDAEREIKGDLRKLGVKKFKTKVGRSGGGHEVEVVGSGVDQALFIKIMDELVKEDFFISDAGLIPQDDYFNVTVSARYVEGGAGEKWQATDPRMRWGKPPYSR